MKSLILLVLILCFFNSTVCEIFSSIDKLETLVKDETEVLEEFQKFVEVFTDSLGFMNR